MGELLHQWKPSDYSIVQVWSMSLREELVPEGAQCHCVWSSYGADVHVTEGSYNSEVV